NQPALQPVRLREVEDAGSIVFRSRQRVRRLDAETAAELPACVELARVVVAAAGVRELVQVADVRERPNALRERRVAGARDRVPLLQRHRIEVERIEREIAAV